MDIKKEIDFKEEYEILHKNGFFNGYSCLKYKNEIKKIINETGSKTLLDYGGGKGFQYSKKNLDKFLNVDVYCYDPYYIPNSILPNNIFDGIICITVMEHIPENEIEKTLKIISNKSRKFVLFVIDQSLAKKKFQDGSNVHVTLKTKEWWEEQIHKHIKDKKIIILYRN